MLKLDSLTKDFATRAVDQVSLEFAPGQVHALLGANGAGKSTLCKVIAGLILPTQGSMLLDGKKYSPNSKRQAQHAGVQIVQQELNVLATLTLAENLFLSNLPNRWGILSRRTMHRRACEILSDFGLGDLDPHARASSLGVGQQQLLEIAANTWQPTQVLILDEPTAALSTRESQRLFEKIQLWKNKGVAILYISHRLAEVQALADRISILRDGKLQGTWSRGELQEFDIVAKMTNPPKSIAPISSILPADPAESSRQALRVEQLRLSPKVQNVSFSLRAGEILGVAGLVGSGRTELLRAIFGADRASGGSLQVADKPACKPFRNPNEAVRAGLVMISEDRKADGLLLSQSIAANIQLPMLDRPGLGRFALARTGQARRIAETYCQDLSIRCDSTDQSVGTLSGGNQQKVVLAKWLERDGTVFLMDEPTRGIDVAARQQVYEVIRNLAKAGKGILVVSSDLEELIGLCDSIGVMSNGRWMANFSGPNYEPQAILEAMFAGYSDP
ncbi:MAG: sugar ABC transporter ATP-binding protein [Pirellula sp.]